MDTILKKNKEKTTLWASDGAQQFKTITVCSTEEDARRVHTVASVATVAFRALPLDAQERLTSRHVVLATRDDDAGQAIRKALGPISKAFASFMRLERIATISDIEIKYIFKEIADPLRWTQIPTPPTAVGFCIKLRAEAQREALAKYISEHPGIFPVICHDLETGMKWVEMTVESAESLRFFRHWFGLEDFFYTRAAWAFYEDPKR